MGNKRDKATAVEAVTIILNEYMIKKHSNVDGEISDEAKRLAESHADMIMQNLYKEVWKMNEKRIEDIYDEKLIKEKEKLEQECKNNERVSSFKNMAGFLFEGIIIASLVGIAINQATELISMVKGAVYNYAQIPVWVTTLIIILIAIVIIGFMLAKQFMDKFSGLLKNSDYTD